MYYFSNPIEGKSLQVLEDNSHCIMPSGAVCILTKDPYDVQVIFKRGISGTLEAYGKKICEAEKQFFLGRFFFFLNPQKLREMDLNFFTGPMGTNAILICII